MNGEREEATLGARSGKTVRELGEFGLIDRINQRLLGSGMSSAGVVAGIGDDTAALKVGPGLLLLATCDVQVEGGHFILDKTTPERLGYKSLAVNLSDIAAMGGTPRFCLVSLGLPPRTPVDLIDGLYGGISALANQHGVAVVGGNIASVEANLFIDITLMGEVEPDRVLYRSKAQIGDRIIVTGTPGDSGGGLALLLQPDLAEARSLTPEIVEYLISRHQRPTPRVLGGRAISATRLARSMLDISDGLTGDLSHICESSEVGAVLISERMPLSPELRALGQAAKKDPLDWALFSGEDYELLLTVGKNDEEKVLAAIQATGLRATMIGEIVPKAEGISLLYPDGRRHRLEPRGFRHF